MFFCVGFVMQHVSAGFDVVVWVLMLLCVGLMCVLCVACAGFVFMLKGQVRSSKSPKEQILWF